MDLFIRTAGVTDLSAAAVKSASDFTALSGPSDFPQLVLGVDEPVSLRFLSAVSTYEAWSDDPTYTMKVSLGQITAGGLRNLAESTIATVATDYKTGTLALTGISLIDYMNTAFGYNSRAASVQLTMQVTVTDPSGNRRVFAMLPVTVLGSVALT